MAYSCTLLSLICHPEVNATPRSALYSSTFHDQRCRRKTQIRFGKGHRFGAMSPYWYALRIIQAFEVGLFLITGLQDRANIENTGSHYPNRTLYPHNL
jgi:hypothetical protein